MVKSKVVVKVGTIQQRILLIRGVKVMIGADLAEVYGVPTRRLNEQVRRNLDRFPHKLTPNGVKGIFEFPGPTRRSG